MLLKNPAGFFAHQFVSLFVRYVLLIVPGKKKKKKTFRNGFWRNFNSF